MIEIVITVQRDVVLHLETEEIDKVLRARRDDGCRDGVFADEVRYILQGGRGEKSLASYCSEEVSTRDEFFVNSEDFLQRLIERMAKEQNGD
jgi:hypothetical protein